MQETVRVLDHGYVRLVESWGSDERIVEAARMSVDKGFEGWGPKHADDCEFFSGSRAVDAKCCEAVPGDERLLAFLRRKKHTSPFEMAGAIFEVKAPIFVFREWHRHRTQSYNEMSARYTPLPDEDYRPDPRQAVVRSRAAAQVSNRQAGTLGAVLDETTALDDMAAIRAHEVHTQNLYETLLAHGWPKELARIRLPVARYSRMRASAILKNWLDFLTLRDDSDAQWEIRQYAVVVREELTKLFPRTLELFEQQRTQAAKATVTLDELREHGGQGIEDTIGAILAARRK